MLIRTSSSALNACRSLVASELQNATLRQLFDLVLPCPYAYYLLQSPHRASRPAVQCFVRWLQQAISEDQTCGAAAACGPGVDDSAS